MAVLHAGVGAMAALVAGSPEVQADREGRRLGMTDGPQLSYREGGARERIDGCK